MVRVGDHTTPGPGGAITSPKAMRASGNPAPVRRGSPRARGRALRRRIWNSRSTRAAVRARKGPTKSGWWASSSAARPLTWAAAADVPSHAPYPSGGTVETTATPGPQRSISGPKADSRAAKNPSRPIGTPGAGWVAWRLAGGNSPSRPTAATASTADDEAG